MRDELLERWLEELVATRGLTGIRDLRAARTALLADALRAVSLVRPTSGRVIDVGSGGGSPGIPLAVALPDREFTLLEADRWKCDFLRRFAAELAHVEVTWGRAEEQPTEAFGVALAKAVAKPPAAAELCLPLVYPGGIAILWVGQTAEPERVARVAEEIGGTLESARDGLLVLRKLVPTPAGFPRRPGMAKKRPLA